MSSPWSNAPTAPALPPPAWYPDPSGVGDLRYWNGSEWTLGVVIGGDVMERPMPWPPVATPTASTEPPDERAQLPGRAALYGLLGFAMGAACGVVLAIAGAALDFPDIAVLLLNLAGLWTGLLWACRKASRRYGTGDIRRDYGFVIAPADVGWGLLMSLAARFAGAIAVIPFLFGPERFLGDNQGVFGEVTDSMATFVVFGIIAVVGAPIVEELFFRGLVLRSLERWVGTAGAVVSSSVLFGLAHPQDLTPEGLVLVMVSLAALGALLAILVVKTGRLAPAIVAHSVFNAWTVFALLNR